MKRILRAIQRLFNPTVDRDEALRIAQNQCIPPIEAFEIYNHMPDNWRIYIGRKPIPDENWYISVPGKCGGLHSTHAIIISRKNGEVIYDGSANNEG